MSTDGGNVSQPQSSVVNFKTAKDVSREPHGRLVFPIISDEQPAAITTGIYRTFPQNIARLPGKSKTREEGGGDTLRICLLLSVPTTAPIKTPTFNEYTLFCRANLSGTQHTAQLYMILVPATVLVSPPFIMLSFSLLGGRLLVRRPGKVCFGRGVRYFGDRKVVGVRAQR